jgi:hypothetical protein
MRVSRPLATLLAGAAFAFPLAALADSKTEIGLFTAVVGGTHVGSDNPQPVSGIVPGALIEFTQSVDRLHLHFEGLPDIHVTGSNNGALGNDTASLGLLNGVLLVDVDPQRRFRLGYGFQLVNLSNFNGNNGDRNQSRVTSSTYEAQASLPLAPRRTLELSVAVDPNLRGILHIFDLNNVAQREKPETGAEVDYWAAYAWHHPSVTYLLGARALSYHTRNTDSGELVDRNVGGGVTFEARFALGRH